jgi:hemerythrin
MTLLIWGSEYSVGVESMDGQHMAMIAMMNDLYDAMLEGMALDITGPLLERLTHYTKEHFAAEEALMSSSRFPGLAEHCARHRQLVAQVEEQIARFDRGDPFLPIQLLHFLRDWIAIHIQQEDRQYGTWIAQRGKV